MEEICLLNLGDKCSQYVNTTFVFTSAYPNGITNITAISRSLKYSESGTYGKNETKFWSITVPDANDGIFFFFSSFLQVRFYFYAFQ